MGAFGCRGLGPRGLGPGISGLDLRDKPQAEKQPSDFSMQAGVKCRDSTQSRILTTWAGVRDQKFQEINECWASSSRVSELTGLKEKAFPLKCLNTSAPSNPKLHLMKEPRIAIHFKRSSSPAPERRSLKELDKRQGGELAQTAPVKTPANFPGFGGLLNSFCHATRWRGLWEERSSLCRGSARFLL